MSRPFFRVGPWLFAAALVLYLGGNFMLDSLHKKNVAHARSLHKNRQYFDAGALKGVMIRAEDENDKLGRLNLVIDPNASQLTITNENLGISAHGQLVDGVFNITLGSLAGRPFESLSELNIRIPSSVNRVGFAGINTIKLSGGLPLPAAELNLMILDCKPTVSMDHLAVDRLNLTTSCGGLPSGQRCCNSGFQIGEEVRIDNLDVAMPGGKLKFSADIIPKQIHLNLGDRVELEGHSAFFRGAQMVKLP